MGLFQAGNASSPNRTSNEVVYEIRKLRATGKWTYEALAIKFDLHPSTIGRYCRRASHRDVAVPRFEATKAEIDQAAFESQRKVLTDLGMQLPDYLKTRDELLLEEQARRTKAEVTELQAQAQAPLTDELKERIKGYGQG